MKTVHSTQSYATFMQSSFVSCLLTNPPLGVASFLFAEDRKGMPYSALLLFLTVYECFQRLFLLSDLDKEPMDENDNL